MTSKFSIDNRELLQRISSGEAVVGIDFGNLIVRELAAFRLAAMDSEPAPVVPAEKPIPNTLSMYAVDAVAAIAEVKGWNACRAAMLAAAPQSPGSEPATVPGKWIPVSEQMPEVGDIVLTAMGGVVNVGETECSAANCRFFTSVISGRELPATHWMQLPAAPQEVGDA
ncbi:TPA: DUF551 domain-containing protein [Klebsiella pneumoniae]|nr:DUF551 domain-containing protein [Klebsiella pneumoniae]KUF72018.1 hypothetical protein AOT23_03344 [Klebsiella pneumoniae]MDW5513879.1 DUF551 domain-containing protein [Klebsiella pneumoniae subsp. pneumoniae]OUC60803.1 hypothetical protein B8B91_01420 [Klebsiella pneumoniae]UWB80504.1 DUF551 domain-containing protein [Klebsiella pneumoniae]UWC43004.1 DUF551 domain-containing protein [Klebsiella pneumoniae]